MDRKRNYLWPVAGLATLLIFLTKLSKNLSGIAGFGPAPWSPDGGKLLYSVGQVFL